MQFAWPAVSSWLDSGPTVRHTHTVNLRVACQHGYACRGRTLPHTYLTTIRFACGLVVYYRVSFAHYPWPVRHLYFCQFAQHAARGLHPRRCPAGFLLPARLPPVLLRVRPVAWILRFAAPNSVPLPALGSGGLVPPVWVLVYTRVYRRGLPLTTLPVVPHTFALFYLTSSSDSDWVT